MFKTIVGYASKSASWMDAHWCYSVLGFKTSDHDGFGLDVVFLYILLHLSFICIYSHI